MIQRDVLLTWLCAWRLNRDAECSFAMPTAIQIALVEEGWIERRRSEGPDEDGVSVWDVTLTDAGLCQADLFGPECGIEDARFEGVV